MSQTLSEKLRPVMRKVDAAKRLADKREKSYHEALDAYDAAKEELRAAVNGADEMVDDGGDE